MPEEQLSIEMPRQKVSERQERLEIWQAVVFLRKHGHTVYRAGGNHLVDGRGVRAKTLLEMAAALGN